jgi:hypothetical protein
MVGFDGFDRNKQNYFTEKYTMEQGKTISVQTVKQILSTSLDQLTLNFITPSLYED